MVLQEEHKKAVAAWIAQGASLSDVQKAESGAFRRIPSGPFRLGGLSFMPVLFCVSARDPLRLSCQISPPACSYLEK